MKKCLVVIFSLLSPAIAWSGQLLQSSDLTYLGAFRVPSGNLGGASTYSDTMARAGAGLAYNPANNSLFIITRAGGSSPEKLVAEISIPTVVNSNTFSALNAATLLQAPADLANSQWNNIKDDLSATGNGGAPGGLLLHNGKLIGSVYGYYDGTAECFRSHFTTSPTWIADGVQFGGMKKVGLWPLNSSFANGGLVGGYMAPVPTEWASQLGYPALTGKGALAVISRSSQGPSIWGFNPDNLSSQDPVTATMMTGYIDQYPLGNYDTGGLPYNSGADYGGMAFPSGSDSVMVFGRKGYGHDGAGESCYGYATTDESKHNTNTCGDYNDQKCCYDLTKPGHGNHAYPYVYSLLMYNAADLKKVKDGTINPATGVAWKPYEVLPYADIDLDADWGVGVSDATGMKALGGVTYDPTTQRIFIAQYEGDTGYNQYEPYPLIRVYQLNLSGTTPPSVGTKWRVRAVIVE